MIKNRRGDIAVTLLVIMTVIMCGAAFYSFSMYDSSVEKSVGDFNNLGNFYDSSRNFEFYLYNLAKLSATNTGEDFVKKFVANYKDYADKQKFYPEYLNQIENLSKYDIKIVGGKIYFRLKDFEFSSDLSGNPDSRIKSILWKKDITFEITLK